jgi:hypothetical protein
LAERENVAPATDRGLDSDLHLDDTRAHDMCAITQAGSVRYDRLGDFLRAGGGR